MKQFQFNNYFQTEIKYIQLQISLIAHYPENLPDHG